MVAEDGPAAFTARRQTGPRSSLRIGEPAAFRPTRSALTCHSRVASASSSSKLASRNAARWLRANVRSSPSAVMRRAFQQLPLGHSRGPVRVRCRAGQSRPTRGRPCRPRCRLCCARGGTATSPRRRGSWASLRMLSGSTTSLSARWRRFAAVAHWDASRVSWGQLE
jgi:hypothetical protein